VVRLVRDRLRNSERGAISIQVALFLPILVIVLIGGVEVWKVLYVQQVLNDAAYQGARLLAMQPNHVPDDTSLPPIPDQVLALVHRYVAANPFVASFYAGEAGGLDAALMVRFEPGYSPGRFDLWAPMCGERVTVIVQLPWYVGRGWTRGPDDWSRDPELQEPWLPFLNTRGVLTARARGVFLCEENR